MTAEPCRVARCRGTAVEGESQCAGHLVANSTDLRRRGVVASQAQCPADGCGELDLPHRQGLHVFNDGPSAIKRWFCSWRCVSLFAIRQELRADDTRTAVDDPEPARNVKVTRTERTVPPPSPLTPSWQGQLPKGTVTAAREWALAHGIPVAPRGALPRAVLERYLAQASA